jgi:hypothetical protein
LCLNGSIQFSIFVSNEFEENFLESKVVFLGVVDVGRQTNPIFAVEVHQTRDSLRKEKEKVTKVSFLALKLRSEHSFASLVICIFAFEVKE